MFSTSRKRGRPRGSADKKPRVRIRKDNVGEAAGTVASAGILYMVIIKTYKSSEIVFVAKTWMFSLQQN